MEFQNSSESQYLQNHYFINKMHNRNKKAKMLFWAQRFLLDKYNLNKNVHHRNVEPQFYIEPFSIRKRSLLHRRGTAKPVFKNKIRAVCNIWHCSQALPDKTINFFQPLHPKEYQNDLQKKSKIVKYIVRESKAQEHIL